MDQRREENNLRKKPKYSHGDARRSKVGSQLNERSQLSILKKGGGES